jgi:hypothetical protein
MSTFNTPGQWIAQISGQPETPVDTYTLAAWAKVRDGNATAAAMAPMAARRNGKGLFMVVSVRKIRLGLNEVKKTT